MSIKREPVPSLNEILEHHVTDFNEAGGSYTEEDLINRPSHYNTGSIEVYDFIEDQRLGFAKGNAVKYICRAGRKPYPQATDEEAEIRDLKKAIWNLKYRIAQLKGEAPTYERQMSEEIEA